MIKLSLIRIAILIALFTIGILATFSAPMDDSATWFSDLIWSKVLGVSSLWLFFRLYGRWRKTDRWIQAYDKWNKPQY